LAAFSRTALFFVSAIGPSMPESDKLTPAEPRDLADAIALALQFEGRKRVHHADEYMAAIAPEPVVHYLERAGFVVMKKPPLSGHAAPRRVRALANLTLGSAQMASKHPAP
jgi:hypothetical protein